MQVTHLDPVVGQEIGQVLGHALGQRRHQHPLSNGNPLIDFAKKIIDLRRRRTYQHLGVDQTGRPHHLLDHLAGMLLLVVGRGRRDENRLPHLRLELVELQRPVVEC
ncbi:hypothetical protein SDC9_169527 [bioreactor metagenome]|uniref:Uncharacterized protein n=1 Tax=bioreactor metagenome TaxID=1076179 RepID=A0A645GDQ5_9ZZZZ